MRARVVNYGCSHAFGSELAKPGDSVAPPNVDLNFGNLVAKHYDRDFKIAARPGNSNKQMLHDVIEHVREGDICLLSWTYADRDRFIEPENDSRYNNCNYTSFHTLSVLQFEGYKDTSKTFMERFFPTPEQERRKKIEASHHFLKNATDPMIQSVCRAHYDYYSHPGIQIMNFLEIYKCVNEIIRSRGARAVNFHYDMESDIIIKLLYHEENDTKCLQGTNCYYDFRNELAETPEYTDYYLCHPTELSEIELYKFYRDDKTRIDFVSPQQGNPMPYPFKQWYMEKFYGDRHTWPAGRLGHLDAAGHECLSKFIIEKLEELSDGNTL